MLGKTVTIDSTNVMDCISDMHKSRLALLEAVQFDDFTEEQWEIIGNMQKAMSRSADVLIKLIQVSGTKIKIV